jgi:hypothetical protein
MYRFRPFSFALYIAGDLGASFLQVFRDCSLPLAHVVTYGANRSLPILNPSVIQPAHPFFCGKRYDLAFVCLHVANDMLLLGEHEDRAAFWRIVKQRGKYRYLYQLLLLCSCDWNKLRRQPIAVRDRACFVQNNRIDVTSRLYCLA